MSYNDAYYRNIELKDYSTRVGNLKSITLFDNNKQIISKSTNHYLHDNNPHYEDDLATKFKNQGVTDETFASARLIFYKFKERKPYADDPIYFTPSRRNLIATISQLQTYPVVQTSQDNYNRLTGMKNQTENIAFDFYSGEVSQVLTTDSYGNRYLSVSVPAYENYSGMGIKVDNIGNKNMLTQQSEQYTYVVNGANQRTGLLSASINAWSDQIPVLNLSKPQVNIWRSHAGYQWNGQQALLSDGSYPYDNGTDRVQNFKGHPFTNWNNANKVDEFWQKTSEVTLCDIYSHVLEAKDINENFAATRLNLDQNKVVASVSNARYNEIAVSNAEYFIGSSEKDGGVARGEGNPSPAYAHTGKYSKGLLMEIKEKTAGGNAENGISRSEYIYRKDGRIRFSQNEEQRNALPQRYSYTNYDKSGRPIESGEYTMNILSIAFNSSAMKAILEVTNANGGLTEVGDESANPERIGIKKERLYTYYDELDAAIPHF